MVDMGEDVGASNVVKLCGNFLIAVRKFSHFLSHSHSLIYCGTSKASIESIAESMALAEKHGVDRHRVMEILSSSIFDCLIYKVDYSRLLLSFLALASTHLSCSFFIRGMDNESRRGITDQVHLPPP